jgi:hypothetical protein
MELCKVTKDGYILKSGRTIRYDTDITDLDVKDITDLNNENGTKWDVFVLHREVQDMSNNMVNNFNRLMTAIELSGKVHRDACPLNTAGISALVEKKVTELADDGLGILMMKRVDDHLKKRGVKAYRGFKGLVRDFILIASALGAFFGLLKLIGN